MIQYFYNNNPLQYVFLFIFTILIRLPAFHPEYYSLDESIYMINAEIVADGGIQYNDTWDNKPPLLVWFYSSFVWIFGYYALTAIRIFTIFILFLSAFIFNQLIYRYRVIPKFTILPGFLLVLLSSTPWYALELNAEHLMMFPMIITVILLALYYIDEQGNWSNLYWIGLLCGICVGIKYQGLTHFLVMIMGGFFLGRLGIKELVTMGLGMLTVFTFIFFGLYFTKSIINFWDIGFLYNFDYMRIGKNPDEVVSFSQGLFEYSKVWGPFILIAIIGSFYARQKYYSFAIRVRRIETIMFLWLIMGTLSILLGWNRLYLHYFIQILPPIIYYFCFYYFSLKNKRWVKIALYSGFIFPILTLSLFVIINNENLYNSLKPNFKKNGWVNSKYDELNNDLFIKNLRNDLKNHPNINEIWVADFLPEIYLKLNKKCALKYTNFSMAFYKMTWLSNTNINLISKDEEVISVYETFSQKMPKYIIDTKGYFEIIKDKLPLLLNKYKFKRIDSAKIFYLN